MPDDWLDLAAELIQVAGERGDVDYLEVTKGELSIRFGRGASVLPSAAPPLHVSPPAAPEPLLAANTGAVVSQPALVAAKPAHAAPQEVAGTFLARSPMVGTFYRAPAPGKPPFIELGATVTTESTVGLVEAMKVFTSIRSEVAGTIEEILCQDGEFIEFDQPLFRVRVA